MEAFDVLIILGTALLGKKEWSLPVLVSNFLTIIYSPPLTATIVLLSQQPGFVLGKDDIEYFISSLFHEEDCEWSCSQYCIGKRESISRSSIEVTLEHRRLRCNDLSKNATFQHLCRKLVGKHTINTHKFRIVPEWEMLNMTEDDRFFGSCLILGHLKDFNDNFPVTSTQRGEETCDWVKHTMWLLERFFEQFDHFAAFLAEEDIVAMCELAEPGHNLKMLLALLSRFAEACRKKSKEELHECQEGLRQANTRDLVQLVQISMKPLLRYGNELRDITENLDTEGSHACLTRALCQVISSNIPLCGAVSALSANIDNFRSISQDHAIRMLLLGCVSAALAGPIAVPFFFHSIIPVCEWYSKSREYQEVQDMHKFSKEVDILGSTCKMYTLLVLVKAGSFFTSDSEQYLTYKRLLKDIFKINLEEEGFQVDTFLRKHGNEIHKKISDIRLMVLKHAKRYDLEPELGDAQW